MAPRQIARIPIMSREQWLSLRKQDVTASVVGALFGYHPYETPAGLWHAKAGKLSDVDEDTPEKRRGRRLEKIIPEIFLEEHPGWKIEKAKVYLRNRLLRLGATPDFFARDPEKRKVIVQAKTVDSWEFKRTWMRLDEDGNPVAKPPTWIILQTLTEAMLYNAHRGIIAVLVVEGALPLYLYEVERHPGAERKIAKEVTKFWASVNAGEEPQLNYERDGALLEALYPHDDGEPDIDLTGDNRVPTVLEDRETVMQKMAELKKQKNALENELINKLRNSPSAKVNGWRLTYREQKRLAYTVEESTFRVLRATRKKEEEIHQ